MTSGERFVELVSQPEIRLDLAALEIANVCRAGEVDVDASLEQLDQLAEQVQHAATAATSETAAPVTAETTAPITAELVMGVLFGQLGFGGDRADYYRLENSYLDRVLAKRSGIPITLAVVTIEVARRVGVEMYGVGMPRHFLLGAEQRLFDPFDGVPLDYEGAKKLFHQLGPDAPFSADYLSPTPPVVILQRILNNLRLNYLRRPQPNTLQGVKELAVVLEMLVCLPNCSPADFLQLADVLTQLGKPDKGAIFLEDGAERIGGDDAKILLTAAARLLARLN